MSAFNLAFEDKSLVVDDLERLISEFERCVLPKKQWTHIAHLVVGTWYCVIVPATPYLCRWHRFANMNLLQLLSASGVKAVGNLGRLNSVSLFRYYFLQLPAALSICPAKTDRSEKWVLPADGQVYL